MSIKRKDIDILIFTMSRWDGVLSSAIFSIAKVLAKTNRVFYIDHPYSLKEVYVHWNTPNFKRRRLSVLTGKNPYYKPLSIPGQFINVTPQWTIPINFLNNNLLYRSLSVFNDKVLENSIRRTIKDNKIENFIFLNSYDPFFIRSLPESLHPLLKIYQSRDDITQEPYVSRHGARLEADALSRADLCLATSRELCKNLSKSGKFVHHLPNAAEFELFNQALEFDLGKPTEYKGWKGKIILYVGNISMRVDHALLRYIAENNTDKLLVIVGPKEGEGYKKQELESYSNIIFTGAKKYNELPHYIKYSDCAIIPFLKNKMTKSIYPLKINEYLAVGKPVVTTDFSDDIVDFANVVYIAPDYKGFVNAINTAIREDSPEKTIERVDFASRNTWENRADLFWDLVESSLKDKGVVISR